MHLQGHRPPSRQKPPPEALHLFQPIKGAHTGAFAPSPVLRAATASLSRPSTSAPIMQQAHPASRSRPTPMLHPGRMTLADVQRLADAAASTSHAIATVPAGPERGQSRPGARPSSARHQLADGVTSSSHAGAANAADPDRCPSSLGPRPSSAQLRLANPSASGSQSVAAVSAESGRFPSSLGHRPSSARLQSAGLQLGNVVYSQSMAPGYAEPAQGHDAHARPPSARP